MKSNNSDASNPKGKDGNGGTSAPSSNSLRNIQTASDPSRVLMKRSPTDAPWRDASAGMPHDLRKQLPSNWGQAPVLLEDHNKKSTNDGIGNQGSPPDASRTDQTFRDASRVISIHQGTYPVLFKDHDKKTQTNENGNQGSPADASRGDQTRDASAVKRHARQETPVDRLLKNTNIPGINIYDQETNT